MARKLSLLLAVIAVVALASPVFASAATVTNGGGGAYLPGTEITGISHNMTTETEALGTLECETVEMKTELAWNSGGLVILQPFGLSSTSTCNEGENSITIANASLLYFESTGYDAFHTVGFGEVTLTFEADLPGQITCHFEGAALGSYQVGTNKLSIAGVLEGGACGESIIEADFALGRTGGGTVVLD